MFWTRKPFLRLKSLFRKTQLEDQLAEELEFHLENEIQKNIAAGMPTEEARYAALRSFGGVDQFKEDCRDACGMRFIEEVWQDLKYGVRMLAKSPAFTVVAISILALGIGANSVVFSFLHALLLRPLPFKDPHRIVVISEIDSEGGSRDVSSANFVSWKERSQAFELLAGYRPMDTILTGHSYADQLMGAQVTEGLAALLGSRPVLGRSFLRSDYEPSAEPVAVMSYSLWQRRFGLDPGILGQTLSLDHRQYTVVGVMPRQFSFWSAGDGWDVWVPLGFSPEELTQAGSRPLTVFGRLSQGMELQDGQAEMELRIRQLAQENPKLYGRRNAKVLSLREWHQAREPAFWGMLKALPMLLGAVAFVLLIACTNLAGLVLARNMARHREIAVRSALGAGRWRLVRQLVIEGLLLSVLGGMLGSLLASWGIKLSIFLIPEEIKGLLPGGKETISIDFPALTFTLVISLLTVLIFGLLPAIRTSKLNLNEVLKERGKGMADRSVRGHGSDLLVVLEITISLVLLVGASLMFKSFLKLLRVNVGFNSEHVVAMLLLSQGDSPRDPNFYNQVVQRVKTLPAVQSVSLMNNVPAGEFWLSGEEFMIEGRPVAKAFEAPLAITTFVDPNFFQAMGIPLLRGRVFTEQDSKKFPGVAIVSPSLAHRYFHGEDPIGKRIRPGGMDSKVPWLSIVGIVGEVRHKLGPEPIPTLYGCYLQQDFIGGMTLFVRTPLPPGNIVDAIRREVWKIDKEQPITYFWTMDYVVSASMFVTRFIAWLLGSYAALALLFSLMGIYGVVSYSVSQRTHEIGVRMALGAQRTDVLRLFLKHAFLLACLGMGGGILAALATTRLLTSQLHGLNATDPWTFAQMALLLVTVVLLASYIPARRASRVDPMSALRHE